MSNGVKSNGVMSDGVKLNNMMSDGVFDEEELKF